MEMNVNRELIKELRLKKSWSQEKLADAAAVSLRTIQRVETDGIASLQSRTAIASALEIEPAELDIEIASDVENEDREVPAKDIKVVEAVWSTYFKPILRFITLSVLWIGMVFSAFLIISTLISGLFFWEMMPFTFWQSVGTGIIGAVFFVPVFWLNYWLYLRVTRPKDAVTEISI